MAMKIILFVSTLTAFVLRERYGYSWIYAIPILVAYFLAFNGYRMLIYERFINPLSRLPGPKVCSPNCNSADSQGHWLKGEFPAITITEGPGKAHIRWLRQYRNPTGLITYPSIFYLRRVMPTSAAVVQHILSSPTYVTPQFVRRSIRLFGGDGLVAAEGKMHARQRKILSPAFATRNVRDLIPIFEEKADNLVKNLLQRISAETSMARIDISGPVRCATLDIIGSAG